MKANQSLVDLVLLLFRFQLFYSFYSSSIKVTLNMEFGLRGVTIINLYSERIIILILEYFIELFMPYLKNLRT